MQTVAVGSGKKKNLMVDFSDTIGKEKVYLFIFFFSFFDDGKESYLKIRDNLHNTVILKIGLSLFTLNEDSREYNANVYRFHLVPRPFGPIQTKLFFQSTNLHFLCCTKFDYNKCFYEGIPFLNEAQARLVKRMLTDRSLINTISKSLDYKDLANATAHQSEVLVWLTASPYNDTYEIHVETDNPSYRYFLHHEIRRRFKETWTFNAEDNRLIIVKRVTKEDRKIHELNIDDPASSKNLIGSLLGFSKIFKLLMRSKKPLVGHDLFLDLLVMYNQFYQDLPLLVFDASLGNVYELLKDEHVVMYQPFVNLAPGDYDKDEQRLHDAGWNSYFTGVCFIKLGYYLINSQNRDSSLRFLTFKECMNSLSFLENKISLASAKINCINLSGKDPPSTRPPILHVCWKSGKKMSEIATLFNEYSIIHKKECSSNSMLIATSNYGCYKNILRDFKQNRDIKVERYSQLWHLIGSKMAICVGILLILPFGWTLWYTRQSWFAKR
uniref:Uncharacterized protein n=1 Tax=Rhodnius prolixus TaxID=13249 RepID=T1HJ73_RHOPR